MCTELINAASYGLLEQEVKILYPASASLFYTHVVTHTVKYTDDLNAS